MKYVGLKTEATVPAAETSRNGLHGATDQRPTLIATPYRRGSLAPTHWDTPEP